MHLPTLFTAISLCTITILSTAIPSTTSLPSCGYIVVEGNHHKGEVVHINADGECQKLYKPSWTYELNKGCSCTFYGGDGYCTGGGIVDVDGPKGGSLIEAWAYECMMAPV